MKKFFSKKPLLLLLIGFNLGLYTKLGIDKWVDYQVKKQYFPSSYIADIKTITYDPENIKEILDNFDKQSYNEIVRYEGLRPIVIVENPMISLRGAVGYANWDYSGCTISLVPGLGERFREVLLHEYMHCFSYGHDNTPGDLMYPSITYKATEESIKEYANSLGFWYGTKRKTE